MNHELLAVADAYMQYKNTATHLVDGTGAVAGVQMQGHLTVGEMTARDGSGNTALLLAPQDEFADCHVTLFAPGKKLTLHAGSETVELLPDADGACGFVLTGGMGALVTVE